MFVFEMFPFIFLISTQVFFNNLFSNNEMNILKYSGKIVSSISEFSKVIIVTDKNIKKFHLEEVQQSFQKNYRQTLSQGLVLTFDP